MQLKTAVIMNSLLIVGMLTLAFRMPDAKASLAFSTKIYDSFDSDTVASGYWEYRHHGGSYEISNSKLRLYMTSEGKGNNSGIIRTIPLGQNMTITARVLGSTLYRFAVTWWLSDKYVSLEFDYSFFCMTTMILPSSTYGWIGQFGSSPAANTWYVLSLEVEPTPFTLKGSVYDDSNNLLGTLSYDLGWNYSDIQEVSAAVWSDAPPCPLSDYYVDWFKVTGYFQAATLSVTVTANPTSVQSGQTSTIIVQVNGPDGPIADALVALSSDKGGTLLPATGYTNSSGYLTSTYTAPTFTTQTTIAIKADATKTGYLDGQGQTQIAVQAATLSVTVTANPTSVQSGQTSTITTRVTYGGNSISGATVTLSPNKGGTLSAASGNTDSNGYFASTYTAPSVTTQTTITITADATKTGYLSRQDQTQITVNPSQPQPDLTLWIYIAVVIIIVFAIGGGIAVARRKSHKPGQEPTPPSQH
jgi:hypothetical protein